jgi:hypothetical protein
MRVADLFPAAQWRHLLRASLRECSYLPDPIAREYMHDYILNRYRDYTPGRRARDTISIPRLMHLRRDAKYALSFLRRANEGYPRPLEKVLLISYGRTGRRRHQLLEAFLRLDLPPDTEAVREMIDRPRKFENGWLPPSIVVRLLKSQIKNSLVQRLGIRPQVKTFAPNIPAENSWGRPLALCRRRNIRRRWYRVALDSILPPLPETDMNILRGLLSGTRPWSPVKRRKGPPNPLPSRPSLDVKFIAEGPEKGHTFRKFTDGRPHIITRRLMRRLWQRIHLLVPVVTTNPTNDKQSFEWGTWRGGRVLALTISNDQIPALFDGLDEKGKLVTKA